MKKDPTRWILAGLATLGVVFTPASWYFVYVRGPYEPSDSSLLVNVLFGMLITALGVFLLVDAPNAKARLFWAVEVIAVIVGIISKLDIFTHLATHRGLLQCIKATVQAVFAVAFLIAHMWAPFTLFGKRTEAYFEKRGLQKDDSEDSTP